jgi:hypothetical protein
MIALESGSVLSFIEGLAFTGCSTLRSICISSLVERIGETCFVRIRIPWTEDTCRLHPVDQAPSESREAVFRPPCQGEHWRLFGVRVASRVMSP